MNIRITDSQDQSAFISAGAKPRRSGVLIHNATQINGWIEFPRPPSPFGYPDGGDCFFWKGTLDCYAGPEDPRSSNILMELWDFPRRPAEGATGTGWLRSPWAQGALTAGAIQWEITHV